MKLSKLFSEYSHLKWGNSEQNNSSKDVKNLCTDSRLVNKGDVFIALKGQTVDGHEYLQQVKEKGAIALVVEGTEKVPDGFLGAVLRVDDTKMALGKLASRFYNSPAENMFCVGVTGTNGKTTVVHMIEAILNAFNWPTGVIGTINHHIGARKWKTSLTTPDNLTFHRRLGEIFALGGKAVAIEASSIALEQQRLLGISFDAVIFTNITRDHLDYHNNMNEYFSCKQKLFTDVMSSSNKTPRFAIINKDDSFSDKLELAEGVQELSYKEKKEDCDVNSEQDSVAAELIYQIISQDLNGMVIDLKTKFGENRFLLPLVGHFNASNAVAAIAVGLAAGVSLELCCLALSKFNGVSGRAERVNNDVGFNVFIDYAHTPDAVKNILSTFKEYQKKGIKGCRIITVFGCGGDRDFGKRELMGKAAAELSDVVIVTSDNPRTEDPNQIIENIVIGVNKIKEHKSDLEIILEVDRELAISKAIAIASKDDMVLILGKGHEDYQIIGEKEFPFKDEEVAQRAIGKK